MLKPKILIFVSDPVIRDLYLYKFSTSGFDCKAFGQYGSDVVNMVAVEKPDILYCDILMSEGGLNGFEAMTLLKGDERTKGIPIICVSNMGMEEDINHALSSGADKFVVSADVKPSELVSIFKEHLIGTGRFTVEDFKLRDDDQNTINEHRKVKIVSSYENKIVAVSFLPWFASLIFLVLSFYLGFESFMKFGMVVLLVVGSFSITARIIFQLNREMEHRLRSANKRLQKIKNDGQ